MPRTHRRTVGDRAFAAAGPTLWNSLPHDITDCVSLTSFSRKPKTFGFLYHFHGYILFNLATANCSIDIDIGQELSEAYSVLDNYIINKWQKIRNNGNTGSLY